jgi:hypothetical protein
LSLIFTKVKYWIVEEAGHSPASSGMQGECPLPSPNENARVLTKWSTKQKYYEQY